MRKLHKWPGIIFLIPAILIGASSIMLSLDGLIQMDKISLPFYKPKNIKPDVRTLTFSDGKYFIGTKSGLYEQTENGLKTVSGLESADIRVTVARNDSLFVGAKQGLWLVHGTNVRRIYNKEVSGISFVNAGNIVLSRGTSGFEVINTNGEQVNEPEESISRLITGVEKFESIQTATLKKFVMDIHTGEAIVGKNLKPYWIALCGLQLLLLAITGIWLVLPVKRMGKKPKSVK